MPRPQFVTPDSFGFPSTRQSNRPTRPPILLGKLVRIFPSNFSHQMASNVQIMRTHKSFEPFFVFRLPSGALRIPSSAAQAVEAVLVSINMHILKAHLPLFSGRSLQPPRHWKTKKLVYDLCAPSDCFFGRGRCRRSFLRSSWTHLILTSPTHPSQM